jgi:SAM-dependent methyltransferase
LAVGGGRLSGGRHPATLTWKTRAGFLNRQPINHQPSPTINPTTLSHQRPTINAQPSTPNLPSVGGRWPSDNRQPPTVNRPSTVNHQPSTINRQPSTINQSVLPPYSIFPFSATVARRMLAFGRDELHPMVDALLRTRVGRWRELNRAIDERDDMLDFAIHLFDGDRDRAVANYFVNGYEQLELVRHIARWRERRPKRMLDFASGYGRLTRFLVHEGIADEVTVADILEEGMQFQAEQFGVKTIVSTTLPQDFVFNERYDLIFVASLFTHLPAVTFTPWLRRLAEMLTDDGLLIFSVHDETLAPEPFDGIHFVSTSESRVLDLADYGSTWVTEDYVRAQVASIGNAINGDAGFACVRLHRALADWQDVYVISPAPIQTAPPRRTPKGFVDSFVITPDALRVGGWASAVVEKADRVELRLDDEILATTRDLGPRPDVAAYLGTPTGLESGWELVIPHASIRSLRYQVVTISAFSCEGHERILYLGTFEGLVGQVSRERSRGLEQQLAMRGTEIDALSEQLAIVTHQRSTLDQQIAAMRQSRFWKARDQWFAFKRKVGLTEEE